MVPVAWKWTSLCSMYKYSLHERFGEHRGYVNNKHLHKATGHHFNLPGHSISDMTIMIIEKLRRTDRAYREERESMYIRDFGAKWSGLNRKKWQFYLLIAILNFYVSFEYDLSYLLCVVVQLFTADDVKDLHEIYTNRYNSPGELISSVNQWAWRVGIFNNKLFKREKIFWPTHYKNISTFHASENILWIMCK